MISAVIDGIAGALYAKFPSYEIYTERMEQGFTPPCFFIECLNPVIARYRANLREGVFPFVVQLYARNNSTIYSALDNVMKALETITVDGDSVHGMNISSELVENILTVSVTYRWRSSETVSGTDMGTLEIEGIEVNE